MCKEIKNVDEFYKEKAKSDGYKSACKQCNSIKNKEYRDNNKKHYKELWEEYKETDICKHRGKRYYRANKEKCLLACKKWRGDNLDKVKEQRKLNNIKYKEKYTRQHKIWSENNPDKIRKYSNDRYYRNKDKIDAKINKNISKHMWESLKGNKQGSHWEILVGYTLNDLQIHLESKFQEGMSFNNYGKTGWHIDHIIPISLWKFEKPEDREFKQCWALCNLQPLWAVDNLRKGNKIW